MTTAKPLTIRLNAADNVVVARFDLLPGTNAEGIACAEPVPAGHKVAVEPIAAGAAIRKYCQIIGFAGADIAPGEHVHNVAMRDFERDYAYCEEAQPTDFVNGPRTFQGYEEKQR